MVGELIGGEVEPLREQIRDGRVRAGLASGRYLGDELRERALRFTFRTVDGATELAVSAVERIAAERHDQLPPTRSTLSQ